MSVFYSQMEISFRVYISKVKAKSKFQVFVFFMQNYTTR